MSTNQDSNITNTPPHSIEAEQMILGGILIDPDSFIEISGMIYEYNFYRHEHQKIFQHILILKAADRNVDAITLSDSLKQTGDLDFIGGTSYLNNLIDATVSAINIKSYAQIVRDRYILRELISAGNKIIELAYFSYFKDVDIILDESEKKIFQIKDINITNKQFNDIKVLLDKVLERTLMMSNKDNKDGITGIPTHFNQLDHLTSGLQAGELIIVAGRPGMGKTSFALNIAENVALKNQLAVAIFSLEMTGEQLVQRMLSSVALVDQNSIKRGEFSHDEMDKLYLAMSELKKAPIYIAESPGINVIDLRSRVRRLKNQINNLGLVVIDYVQIMSGLRDSRGVNRAQEIADISRSLKSLALELNVPIILLSQLNREVESRQDKRPNIADLRESGALEQDADIILLLYRDSYYDKESKKGNLSEINIAKNRSGSTGIVELAFLAKCTKFENPYIE